ncbi:MAG: GGDEF domain-containing protein [Clostridiaceae bacterium]
MLTKALYVEVSITGVALLAVILANQSKSVGSSSLQRQFNRMIYATIAILIIDAACWVIDGTTFRGACTLNFVVETLYYFFNIFMPFLWAAYTESALTSDSKRVHRRTHLLALPLVAYIVLLFLNLKNNWIFVIDAQNHYHRGDYLIITFLLAYGYLLYASVRALAKAAKYRFRGEGKQYLAMAYFLIPPTIGGVIQTLYFGMNCIWIGTVIGAVLVYIDMLNRQISTEPLTGLNNRRELMKFLSKETREFGRSSVLALIMLDIDRFKEVNDTYGHFRGDELLVTVADVLKRSCKQTPAFLARIGGDEFCVVYPADSAEAVESLIAKVEFNVSAWNASHNELIPLSLSIGYSLWQPETDDCIDALYKRADQSMYEAKRARSIKRQSFTFS